MMAQGVVDASLVCTVPYVLRICYVGVCVGVGVCLGGKHDVSRQSAFAQLGSLLANHTAVSYTWRTTQTLFGVTLAC